MFHLWSLTGIVEFFFRFENLDLSKKLWEAGIDMMRSSIYKQLNPGTGFQLNWQMIPRA